MSTQLEQDLVVAKLHGLNVEEIIHVLTHTFMHFPSGTDPQDYPKAIYPLVQFYEAHKQTPMPALKAKIEALLPGFIARCLAEAGIVIEPCSA